MKSLDEFIEKFQKIYFEEYGEKLTREEACDNFLSLVDILKIISRPILKQSRGSENPGSALSSIDETHGNGRLKKPN